MTRIAITTLVAIFLIMAMPVIYTLITGDFPGSTKFYGLQEDHEFVNTVFTFRNLFTK